MTWEIAFVFGVVLLTVASFVWEKWPADQTAIAAFALILLGGLLPGAEKLPDPRALLGVFANPAPLTIAAMFIISAAMEKSGVIEGLATRLNGLTKLGYSRLLLVMVLAVAAISAFINNTPVVVIFLPVMLSLARQLGVAASKLLIPLSYASIFGGTCTLVGTSPNLLASGILSQAGFAPLSMFELSKIGLPLLAGSTLYLVLFGRKLLPDRAQLTAILSEEERKEYFTEAFVRPGSQLVGQSARESGLLKTRGLRLLELIRDEVALKGDLKDTPLEAGDRLILALRPSGMKQAQRVEGLDLGIDEQGLETIAAHEGSIVEGVIGPRSTIVGRTIHELNFRQRFRMIILAIHRQGINMREKIDRLPLQPGDTLLMMGTDQAREEVRRGDDILLLDRPATPAKDYQAKAPIVVTVLGLIIASSTFGWAPIEAAVLLGVAVVFATGSLKPKEGYAAIDWSILLLIYGMLGVGMAMETSGASQMIADGLIGLTQLGIPPEWQPWVLLAGLYLTTMLLTEVISNAATVVLMAPLAITLAATMGIDPRPFIVATCIASSASFATPIGYQTNTYVYGVGGYKFTDFTKVGLPLNLWYFTGCVILIPLLWPFSSS